jgi:hypothetical protein
MSAMPRIQLPTFLALLLALVGASGPPAAQAVTGDILVTGADAGGAPHVRVYDAETMAELFSFFPYDPAFRGGVRVAAGDVDGDGIADVITAPGPGGGPHVKVFDGVTGAELASFFAFDPGFAGGVTVAAGDVNGDGRADIAVGAGVGGGPHVQVFDGRTLGVLSSFFAFDPGLRNGVSVGAGDLTGDGRADIVVGAGPGGGPHVKAFDGVTGAEVLSFFAFDPGFRGGVAVAAGDLDEDGRADVVAGAGPGGGPEVRMFSGADGSLLASLFAYDAAFLGGARVGAGRAGVSERPALLTLAGPGGGSHGRVVDPATLLDLQAFSPYPGFTGGGFVAGSQIGLAIAVAGGTRVICRKPGTCEMGPGGGVCQLCQVHLPDDIHFECDDPSNACVTGPSSTSCAGDCLARHPNLTYDCGGGTCRATADSLSCERTSGECTSFPSLPPVPCVAGGNTIKSIDREASGSPFTAVGVVTICKVTVGGNDVFPFVLERDFPGNVPLGSISNGGSIQRSVAVATGTRAPVRLSETVPAGWTLTDITCDAPGYTKDLDERSAAFTVGPDEHVTCTFTNTKGAVAAVRPFPDGLTLGEAANNVGSFGLPPGNRIAIAAAEGYYIVDAITDQIPTAGSALLSFTSFVPNVPLYGVLVLPDPLGGDADALFTHGPTGTTRRSFDPIAGDFGPTQITPRPGFNATDAVQFGGDPAAQGAVWVNFTGGQVFAEVPQDFSGQVLYDPTLLASSTAFAGASGKAISAFAWSLTFDQATGNLAAGSTGRLAAVTDGQPGQLYLVDPATPQDAATLVGGVGNDPRRIRCLPSRSLCAVSNFGGDSLTIVRWDGGTTISIAGTVAVGDGPVGIDLREDGANTAVISTGFNDDTVTVTVLAADGSVISNATTPAPTGCASPGHATWLRNTPGTAVVTCNGSSAYAVVAP